MNRILQVVLFLTAVTVVLGANCPAGYYKRFGGNCYKIWAEKKRWAEAHILCGTENAHLVTLNDQLESDWVNSFFINNRRHDCGKYYWIGLTDLPNEGVWTWLADNSPVHYTKWNTGEPNNSGDEDGVQVDSELNKWNDSGAWMFSECFICELDPDAMC
ncbi:perlucin-like protein [Acanthaster planci]|uniref:Perlucin-like protein n=1 Tax=Acanthaster planci TaxID=133434 RepID=A0A8B7YE59_ACAPL|nr:perlucin-like protein [Acanthaster planci]